MCTAEQRIESGSLHRCGGHIFALGVETALSRGIHTVFVCAAALGLCSGSLRARHGVATVVCLAPHAALQLLCQSSQAPVFPRWYGSHDALQQHHSTVQRTLLALRQHTQQRRRGLPRNRYPLCIRISLKTASCSASTSDCLAILPILQLPPCLSHVMCEPLIPELLDAMLEESR